MKKRLIVALATCGAILWATQTIWASAETNNQAGAEPSHGALNPLVLVGVAAILLVAKFGGELFERMKQPAVLGELISGIIIGNLALVGFTMAEPLKTDEVIGALAEIGVIILLFEVGLESNLGEMLEVGWSSLFVAIAGVIAPFFLGWGVAAYFIPEEAGLGHIFIGATLCATSVGITARVLKDMGRLTARESRIILGAAVIDDVLGLLILAVVAGAIRAAAVGAALSGIDVVIIAVKAIVFLLGAVAIGHYVMPHLFRNAGRLESRGVLLALAIAFCFLLAWVASLVGLAPIVGAFAAGLVLDEIHFESFRRKGEQSLEDLLAPVSTLLVPIFFVLMGLKVDLSAFARPELLGFAAVLTVAAIIGKQVCSLAVVESKINRLAIGLGMIPRGEVGLIFAGIGASLTLPNAQGVSEPVINAATFGAVVIMVIVTTLVTPPALKWSLSRTPLGPEEERSESMRKVAEDSASRTSR
ncbi:MAG: cation:proton antiporter [Blastocatellia bacterium]|nr:cation:proton antiporter [Blastocatellia bacterium]